MIQNPQEVITQIENNQYAPAYFFQGEEPYYIDKLISYIEDKILLEEEKAFNFSVFYGKDSSILDIISRAKAYPMGANYQVIIIKEAQDLSDLLKPANFKLIESYLTNPLQSTILAFAYKNEVLDKRTAIAKLISENTVFVTCSKIYDNKLPQWINDYVSGKNLKIDIKATVLLQQYIGSNLILLASEIDKICINVPINTLITDDHVQEYVGINKKYNVFELQNAIAEKQFHNAQKIAQNLMFDSKSNSIVAVLGVMFSFFTKMLILHQHIKKSPSELAALLQVPPFFVDQYLRASKNYSLQKSMQNIEHIHKADLEAKGIDAPVLPDSELLKMLICKIFY